MFIMVMIIGCFEIVARKIYVNEFSDFDMHIEKFYADMDELQVVVLGSSQLSYSVNPQYLSGKCFNLALPAQDVYYNYRLFMDNLDKLDKISSVILELGYITACYDQKSLAKNETVKYSKHFITPRGGYDTSTFLQAHLKFFHHRSNFVQDITKYLRRRFRVSDRKKKRHEPKRVLLSNGFYYNRGSTDASKIEQIAIDRAAIHNQYYTGQGCAEGNIKLYLKLVRYLLRSDIQVFIVIPPTTSEYKVELSDELKATFEELFTLIKGIKDENLVILDYSHPVFLSNSDYLDSDHLNFKGAKKLSQDIEAKLRIFSKKRGHK
ncbi:hypothetical protein J7L48_02355 [bacterium]|nr:hypothetical protein [bacterium]